MPVSGPEADALAPGQALAVTAEALYLANLLLLPGIAFLVLLFLYLRQWRSAPALARCHLSQTVAASLWAGVILGGVTAAIVSLGGFAAPWTWVVVVLYFTLCHSTLVLLGVFGLSKAMAGRAFRYPLIGRPCDAQ